MNSDVLEIYDIRFGVDNVCTVEAIVEDAILVYPQTHEDPPEWGPALCRGSFYLCEEDVMPATDAGLKRLVSKRITDWDVVDTSDYEE